MHFHQIIFQTWTRKGCSGKCSHELSARTSKRREVCKDRVSVLVGACMEGERLPLLVIGKSKADFDLHIPVTYRNNTKAWMTREIFSEWIMQLNAYCNIHRFSWVYIKIIL